MARIFEDIAEWETYVPDIDNERALFIDSPDEALTVEIRCLTAEERDAFIDSMQRAIDAESTKARGKTAPHIARKHHDRMAKRLLSECVRNVRNYVMPARLGGAITTGAELAERGEDAVKGDIIEAVLSMSRLSEGLAKKLNGARGSLPAETAPPSDGTARDAVLSLQAQMIKETQTPKAMGDSPTPQNGASETAMAKQMEI